MTICPRCGANNDTGRSACWDCFAPLQGAPASRVKPMLLAGHGGVTAPVEEPGEVQAAPAKRRGLFGKK